MLKQIIKFNKTMCNYHEFLIDKNGNIIQLNGSHSQTVDKILKQLYPERHAEMHNWWDCNINESIFYQSLEKIEMVAVMGITIYKKLYTQGIPNNKQIQFIEEYNKYLTRQKTCKNLKAE